MDNTERKLIKQVFTGDNGLELVYTNQIPELTINVVHYFDDSGLYKKVYLRDGGQRWCLCTIPESNPKNNGLCWHTAGIRPWYEADTPLRKNLLINIWEK